jgi:hypothetical protein
MNTELKGPRGYRFLVTALNISLAILIYWFLGFILDDIGSQPGPSWQTIQSHFQNPALVKQKNQLTHDIDALTTQMNAMRKQQVLLQASINSYRDMMNQLLDLQKASAQKNQTVPPQTQENLADATKLYLDNQQKFQVLNSNITQANMNLQKAQNQLMTVNTQLDQQIDTGNNEYNKLLQKHNLKTAFLKLSLLIPLLLIAAYFFKTYQQSIYRPITIAVGVTIIIKIVMVMHEHFPSRLFKYFLILLLIGFVIRALIKLLNTLISPKANWLQKQYKEAYKKLCCPSCEYPIRPGILKYSTFTQENLKNIFLTDSLIAIPSYSCPSCGIKLFDKCNQCNNTRHALLNYCEICGNQSKN